MHLPIPRKTLKLLMVPSALAIKERNTFESQNKITVVQAAKVKLGGHYRHNFREAFVLLRT